MHLIGTSSAPDPSLVFLILSFEKLHPSLRELGLDVVIFNRETLILKFQPTPCTFEILAAACIFASRVPGEPLNLL